MARVKRGTISLKRRRNVLKQVKGYRFGRSKKERMAKDAIVHAGSYAFRDRRAKKRSFRQLWTVRLNAALRENGLPSYSKFIGSLKKKGVTLDRKSLSALAKDHPEAFVRMAKQLA
jgi:large subunit ribosomal protein L20